MKKFIIILTTIIIAISSCTRIDAGCEGMKVHLYGSNKGVDDVASVTGWVFFNPFTTKVYEYPTFVQTIDYPEFTINAKDGPEFIVDPTISLRINEGQSPVVFKKYRLKLDKIIEGVLFNYIRDAFRVQLNQYTTDELVSKRAEFEKNIESYLSESLEKEGFHLEQLTSGLKYPSSIEESINRKVQAEQNAMRAQNEVALAKAEAEKLIVAAQAEKEANELKNRALTKEILQQMWIEKWDGKVPTFMGTGSNTFISLGDLK